ncbi:hemolysin activation/secretion protein [Paucimonas lemoignei]|uniref:Hemolysin activation/secretion protein n=1 Tax=Paucimonas lemoignei TaxID=29443 RepID=A0A4R3HZ60_PAULE|nr:ShlB/FhaC/HecB family hemolysin secretion/activation protein [Paucimonas lemoignei]TCS37535.1 hemolysin activation/secretion protein [Paucimonas lemoignei]
MTIFRTFRIPFRHAAVLPLGLLLQAWACAAEAPITPGSVLDSLGNTRPRQAVTPPQVLLPLPSPPSEHDPRARRFRVNAFAMSGNTVFRERRLKQVVERFVDQELNLYDLNKAAAAITEFYHARGYTLARAVIPAQRVADGIVKLQIIEGRIGKLRFSGNRRFAEGFLATRTQMLQPGTLVTTERLEHDLLLLNDIPGLAAKVVLEPGAEFGTTDAEVKITEKLVTGSISLNNNGRNETGRNRLEAGLSLNSPFGWGDQLSLTGSITDHSLVRYWTAAYSLPLNTLGTRLSLSAARTGYDVSGAAAALGITGEVKTAEVGVSHPLVRTRENSQWLNVGLRRSRLVQNALGVTMSDNKISVLNLAYQLNHIHEDSAVTNLKLGLTSNFKGVRSATQQDAVRARYEVDVNHTSPFVQRWDLYLRGTMVYSAEMLPDTEKFSLGGPGSVRAYRPSEVRGDSGYLGTAELRHPFEVFGRMGMFRLTLDTGEVIYKMPGYADSRDKLHSAGVGAVLYAFKGVTASIDLATALGNRYKAADGQNHRVWMNVSASF